MILLTVLGVLYLAGSIKTHASLWAGLWAVTAFHILLVILLSGALSRTGLGPGWQVRLPFLVSLGLGVLQTLLGQFDGAFVGAAPGAVPPGYWAVRLLVVFSAALAGGVITTTLRDGLVEVNYPPSAQVQGEVRAAHAPYPPRRGSQAAVKRAFDLLLASFALLVSAPAWILFSFLIWLEDPGPLLFVKNSVGLGGRNFRQFKFRSMVHHAEQHTGPVLAQQNDARTLRFGRLMRKTAMDELPQLLNILRGEMSFVGPRPQRTVLVHEYLSTMPEYAARHAVRPGLAGLAQVASHYYLTPRQKLRFDRVYIANMSLGFDLKLVFLAFALAFYFRWQKGWNGRLPRRLLRFASPQRR